MICAVSTEFCWDCSWFMAITMLKQVKQRNGNSIISIFWCRYVLLIKISISSSFWEIWYMGILNIVLGSDDQGVH